MEKVTKFKAVDGTEFSKENDCVKYELLIKRVERIMSVLPQTPKNDNCSFANGGGYIQHDKTIIRHTKVQLLELMKEYIDHKWIQDTIDNENVHSSYVGRLVSDYNIKPLNDAWYRFMCIDEDNREWGQPYFANYPVKGVQKQLN